MIRNKIILNEIQTLIPSKREYNDEINLFISSPKELLQGKIVLITNLDIYIDFGIKPIIKISKKQYIQHLVQTYIILNDSYLLMKKSSHNKITKEALKEWTKTKVKEGQIVNFILDSIEAIKDIHTINFKLTLEYIKYSKFFIELENIKKSNKTITGFILDYIKGGFCVSIGILVAFLPVKELMRKPDEELIEYHIHASMDFKIAKINSLDKDIILTLK